MKTVCK